MKQEYKNKTLLWERDRVISRHRFVIATASAAIIAAWVASGSTLRYPTQGRNDR